MLEDNDETGKDAAPGVVESKELPESIIRRTDQSHERHCVHQPDRRGEVRVHLPEHPAPEALITKDMRIAFALLLFALIFPLRSHALALAAGYNCVKSELQQKGKRIIWMHHSSAQM